MSYTHTYYADFGQLGQDIEVTVQYHTTKGFLGSQEEPEEPEGFEIDSIDAKDIGNLMGMFNKNEDFADDVNERIATEHEDYSE